MLKKVLLLICVFLLGIVATNIYSYYASAQTDLQLPENNDGVYEYQEENALDKALLMLHTRSNEIASPIDRIREDQILVTNEKIVINLKDAEWASFTDTNSMDPVIDEGAHAIEVIPTSEDQIQVGDIVAYESEYAEGTIIHRVVYKGEDEQGTYFVLKGDNNPTSDPGKVRFEQIKRVVVAIIY
nr:signal peptidase I [Nanoarchaeota archaeon]